MVENICLPKNVQITKNLKDKKSIKKLNKSKKSNNLFNVILSKFKCFSIDLDIDKHNSLNFAIEKQKKSKK